MDKQKTPAVYKTILGRNPKNPLPYEKKVVVFMPLPYFSWVKSDFLKCEYGHFGYRLEQESSPVNIQIYGDRKIIEGFVRSGKPVVCELELIVKKLMNGREYILVNLFLTNPNRQVTHEFAIVPAPLERPWFVYTTKNMNGTGILVRPF
ncbi:MAG: hypothetical protein NTW35_02390 [Candidatus Nomurabacteria bacterium]|nr:hypothetical protein [Candidatus Nomurabacteria bacterium]